MNTAILVLIVLVSLFLLAVALLIAWAWWWPLNPDYQCECCGDEPRVPPVYGDDR